MYSGVCFCCTEQNSDYGWLEMSRYFFFWEKSKRTWPIFPIYMLLPMMLLLLLMLPLDDNSISLYCHVVINSVINVTPTHTIFKKRLNDLRWYSDPDDDDDDDVMADAEYSPIFQMKMKARTYLHYYYFKSHILRWNYWIIYIFCQGGLNATETHYQTKIHCDVHKIKWYFLDAREDLMGG